MKRAGWLALYALLCLVEVVIAKAKAWCEERAFAPREPEPKEPNQ